MAEASAVPQPPFLLVVTALCAEASGHDCWGHLCTGHLAGLPGHLYLPPSGLSIVSEDVILHFLTVSSL